MTQIQNMSLELESEQIVLKSTFSDCSVHSDEDSKNQSITFEKAYDFTKKADRQAVFVKMINNDTLPGLSDEAVNEAVDQFTKEIREVIENFVDELPFR